LEENETKASLIKNRTHLIVIFLYI